MTTKRRSTAIYLYCITDGGSVAASAGLHPLRPVYSIVHEELAAVVSEVPLEEFGEEALPARLEDACWLEREVRAHEAVIESVLARQTVLPMRFCTIFRTGARVRSLLRSRRQEFLDALTRVRGKEEWEVKLCLEPSARAGPPAAEDERGSASSGAQYLMRKREERRIGQEAMAGLQQDAGRSLEALAGCVEAIQLKPVGSPSPDQPRVVWDAVCLVAKVRFQSLRQRVEALETEVSGRGLRFELIGPWPPYHFTRCASGAPPPPAGRRAGRKRRFAPHR